MPPVGMDICLLSVSCVVRQRSLRRADHSSRGALPTVVLRCVWSRNIKNRCSIYIYIYNISSLRVNNYFYFSRNLNFYIILVFSDLLINPHSSTLFPSFFPFSIFMFRPYFTYCFYVISSSVYFVCVSYILVTRLSRHASVNVCDGNTAM